MLLDQGPEQFVIAVAARIAQGCLSLARNGLMQLDVALAATWLPGAKFFEHRRLLEEVFQVESHGVL
jgi:hypothetical protein